MDLDLQEHFPLTNPLPPEIENSHRIIQGSRYLMWSMQFLLSLSLLSLFISYLTGISLYYSYTYYFSTFFLPLVTRALERKYMFLLCNSLILVFVVGFRGFHDHDHHVSFDGEIVLDKHHDNYVINVITGVQLESDMVALRDSKHESVASLEGEVEEEEEEEEEEGGDCDDSFMEEADHDPKEDEEGEGRKDDEDKGADKELVGSSSSTEDDEELNKKFDEFIRKMKEELRLEAKEYQIIAA